MKKQYFSKEKYMVEIVRDEATGVAVREMWYRLGELDRVNDPAVIIRDPTTGEVAAEIWYTNGKRRKRPLA